MGGQKKLRTRPSEREIVFRGYERRAVCTLCAEPSHRGKSHRSQIERSVAGLPRKIIAWKKATTGHEHDSPYNRDGSGEEDPRLLPHPGAPVVPAVAKVHHGISDADEAPERVGNPNGIKVANHRSVHDPVDVYFIRCVGGKH